MNTPDVTPAQWSALTGAAAAILGAIATLDHFELAVVAAAVVVLGSVWMYCDAKVRGNRARIAEAQALTAPSNPPVPAPDPALAVDPRVLDDPDGDDHTDPF